jgi:hypothetical protein
MSRSLWGPTGGVVEPLARTPLGFVPGSRCRAASTVWRCPRISWLPERPGRLYCPTPGTLHCTGADLDGSVQLLEHRGAPVPGDDHPGGREVLHLAAAMLPAQPVTVAC